QLRVVAAAGAAEEFHHADDGPVAGEGKAEGASKAGSEQHVAALERLAFEVADPERCAGCPAAAEHAFAAVEDRAGTVLGERVSLGAGAGPHVDEAEPVGVVVAAPERTDVPLERL